MPKYEVVIVYKGQESYIVEASNNEEAVTIACQKYRNGEKGDSVGTEYEEIENIVTYDESGTEF
jgi:hypothetical protein